jgi:hypothetical protein
MFTVMLSSLRVPCYVKVCYYFKTSCRFLSMMYYVSNIPKGKVKCKTRDILSST